MGIIGQVSDSITMTGGLPAWFWPVYAVAMIFILVTMWVLFTKAGRPGWESLIPFYNTYVMIKIAKRPGWWFWLLLIPFVNFVIIIIVFIDLAKAFGKGTGFGLGLIFLGIIFFPILAFGSATYQADTPTEALPPAPA